MLTVPLMRISPSVTVSPSFTAASPSMVSTRVTMPSAFDTTW